MAKEVRTVAAVMCMPKYQKAVSVAIVQTALQEISLFCSCVLDMLQWCVQSACLAQAGILCFFSLSSAVDDCATLTSTPAFAFLSSFRTDIQAEDIGIWLLQQFLCTVQVSATDMRSQQQSELASRLRSKLASPASLRRRELAEAQAM